MKTATVYMLLVLLTGCAGFGKKMRNFLNGNEEPSQAARSGSKVKFSADPNVNPNGGEKQYRRVNREIFEKEGLLEESSGSLWVMEGQGSYLFSQNLMRISGDVVNINLDGVPRSSLEKKVDIIKGLLDRTRKQAPRTLASDQNPNATAGAAAQPTTAATGPDGQPVPPGQPGAPPQPNAQAGVEDKAEAEEEKKSTFDVSNIPSRIVEKTPDGSYRIKGSQTFMIGRREYKVIATGIVRPSDIKNDSIDSSRLVDSKFDVVAIRKETK